ncbi:GGDEF domain-containing protein [Stutzerimonas balearica]|uniref:GGDEF domain-containing protein n=1 Tax=Stutzerimonas balearica TaxID=74829 RepID=UPI001BAF892B
MINDAGGHKAGDQSLPLVAERLQKAVRQSDSVARLGGDEFVVILEDLGHEPEEAIRQVSRIGKSCCKAWLRPSASANPSRPAAPASAPRCSGATNRGWMNASAAPTTACTTPR